MKILSILTIRNLKLNKKRTIGMILGIILSVALICAVSMMVISFRETLIDSAINNTGYYHIKLNNIKKTDLENLKLNRDIGTINAVYNIGYAPLVNSQNENKPYVSLYSMNEYTFDNLSFKLVSGKFPTNDNEIVITEAIISNAKVNLKIGDKININVGDRVTTDDYYSLDGSNPYNEGLEEIINTVNKEYTIVGIMERPNYSFESYNNPGYTIITTSMTTDNINAYIALDKPQEFKTSITEVIGANNYSEVETLSVKDAKYDYDLNHELLRWEVFDFSDTTMDMLMAVATVVIIIILITSIFCIRNSFSISTTEKAKMYGMLSSVGATKKQIKKNVLSEGLILGLIGIPLGILGGVVAVFILIKVVNIILSDSFNNINGLVFKMSFIPIIISIILGLITIYFSSISSAKRASKVMPLDNLRSTKDITINAKKLHTPKLVKKIFKTGGTIAYKNLKRSKKKYRTTIISLTVSIFVFISMSAFINEGFKESNKYYQDLDYNIIIALNRDDTEKKINKIKNLDNINHSYLAYETFGNIKITDLSKINIYEDNSNLSCYYDEANNCIKYIGLGVILLDDETFQVYIKNIKGNYEDLKDKGILADKYRYYNESDKKEYEERRYKYKDGDIINSSIEDKLIEVEIGKVTDIRPFGYENTYYGGGYIVLNAKYFNNLNYYPYILLIDTNDNEKLMEDLEEIDSEINVTDLAREVKTEKSVILVISIFLYGFIAVITLIGVTNIFNTITSNMELRQKEFAMLKSIGMTKLEFNRMINLETILYSSKSLIYGIVLGIIGAYAIHMSFNTNLKTTFTLPYQAIMISIIFVFIIVYMIMKYSINKINKQNIIETIRKENI